MNRDEYRTSDNHEVRYKGLEGKWVYITSRKDPRVNLRGYVARVNSEEVELKHICDDGTTSLVILGNESDLLMGESKEETIKKNVEEMTGYNNEMRKLAKRKKWTMEKARSRII